MRYLYLDDSGKIHANDQTRQFGLAGFSIDEGVWHQFIRQANGAKSAFFPSHGKPYEWEMRSVDFITSNSWKRSRRRGLCFEVVNILKRNACHVYAVSLEKSKAMGALDEMTLFPLAFQRLIAKFNAEIVRSGTTGSIVCDWSTHKLYSHLSNCITSMVVTNKMDLLRGGVTYGSSSALVPLQVSDLIAGAIRRSLEGDRHIDDLSNQFQALRYIVPGSTDIQGYAIDSILKLF